MKPMRFSLSWLTPLVLVGVSNLTLAAGLPVTVSATGGLPECQATLNTCNTNLRDCDAELSTCKDDLANALKSTFPATGQTKCWDTDRNLINCSGTGQDGDIQAGAPLSYTDNGDGTITDNNTKLMWEKKDDSGSIHDKDNTYTWYEAFDFIAALNNTGFAGHQDWRLPNVRELQSIINYGQGEHGVAVSEEFNNACVDNCTAIECSCTALGSYWSSTTYAWDTAGAWLISGRNQRGDALKSTAYHYVRAVRGGLTQ